jgi:enamine deaminase RidA (YjgF/YER057c/UK114 family)
MYQEYSLSNRGLDYNIQRQHASTSTEWEAQNSYSQAIRTGNIVYIAETTAVDTEGNIAGEDDPHRSVAI